MPSAVAVKVAVVLPDVTTTDAGTVSAKVALLESATVSPLALAGLERVTLQVVVLDAARLVLLHDREFTAGSATSAKLAVALTPFHIAVAVAA